MTTLIIGLGNVGKTYANTRHNMGFLVVEELAKKQNTNFSKKTKLKAEIAESHQPSGKLILAKPTTLMNLSGQSAKALQQWTKAEKIIVIYDDADLELGKIKERIGGGSAGHNGVKSLINTLGKDGFIRIRVGIGRPNNENIPLDEWVLGKWSDKEKKELPEIIENAIKKVEENI